MPRILRRRGRLRPPMFGRRALRPSGNYFTTAANDVVDGSLIVLRHFRKRQTRARAAACQSPETTFSPPVPSCARVPRVSQPRYDVRLLGGGGGCRGGEVCHAVRLDWIPGLQSMGLLRPRMTQVLMSSFLAGSGPVKLLQRF